MPKLPALSPKRVITILKQHGFLLDHSTGSHFVFYHPESKKRIVVGINEFVDDKEPDIDLLKIPASVEKNQCQGLKSLRKRRDNLKVKQTLEDIRKRAKDGRNLMPAIIDAVKCYVTEGEIIQTLRQEFGEYREPPIYW